jgi:arylsulfatase A-like enzyme
MRVPLIWRPAASSGVAPDEVTDPVGHVDLAPTFCAIAGLTAPDWMEGAVLPRADGTGNERMLTEWDSQLDDFHLRSIYRDGWTCTAYEPGGRYDGTEGELYDLAEDPLQRVNRWEDSDYESLRSDLVADLYDHLPPAREPRLEVEAPV